MKHDKHAHGTFSWIELATSDAAAAKKFYGELFGWSFEDSPAGPDMVYTMVKANGQIACALYGMGKDMKGVPPHWTAYVTVDDVDATAKKVTANGGKLVKEPFDVMTFGRMAVATDPSGATFAMWQAKEHIGAHVTQEPGTLAWTELMTNNVDACGKFYVNTLGWKTEAQDMGPMGTYTLFKIPGQDKNVGGMMALPPDMKNVPSHWLSYITVTDCDASTKKAKSLGAKVLVEPMDIPKVGRFSVLQDPQGATIALYKHGH